MKVSTSLNQIIVNKIVNTTLFSFNIACPLRCQNGGTVDTSSCTCDCADGYSGKTCGCKPKEYNFYCYSPVSFTAHQSVVRLVTLRYSECVDVRIGLHVHGVRIIIRIYICSLSTTCLIPLRDHLIRLFVFAKSVVSRIELHARLLLQDSTRLCKVATCIVATVRWFFL